MNSVREPAGGHEAAKSGFLLFLWMEPKNVHAGYVQVIPDGCRRVYGESEAKKFPA